MKNPALKSYMVLSYTPTYFNISGSKNCTEEEIPRVLESLHQENLEEGNFNNLLLVTKIEKIGRPQEILLVPFEPFEPTKE